MRLLIDAQLPKRLAAKLSSVGHDAIHVGDILPINASDVEIARQANQLDAIVVSKDEDFVELSLRGVLRTSFLWIRSGNMTTAKLWAVLEPSLADVELAFAAGDRIVEVCEQ